MALPFAQALAVYTAIAVASTKPAPPPPDTKSVEERLTEVQDALEAGRVLHDTNEFAAAIAQFETALKRLADVPDARERDLKAPSIVVALVEAHLAAYLATEDASHLSAADAELRRYIDNPFELEPDVEEKVLGLRAQVDALIAETKAETPRRRDAIGGRPEVEADADGLSKKQKLVIGGAVTTGVAGGLAIGFVTLLAVNVVTTKRVRGNMVGFTDAEEPSQWATIAVGAIAGATLITGVALLVVGKRRKPSNRWVLAPGRVPGGFGVHAGSRF